MCCPLIIRERRMIPKPKRYKDNKPPQASAPASECVGCPYKEQIGTFLVPKCKTLDELLKEYVDLYGKAKWSLSTYEANVALIEHYISPKIGTMKITDINTRVIERYYQALLKTEAVPNNAKKPKKKLLTAHTVRDIHKILRSCFNQTIKWDMMVKNPAGNAMVPKAEYAKRDIWTAETLLQALHLCDDPRLALALNVSFCCSLRMGEMLGLTWDCIDISEESIAGGTASVYVNKELRRVNRKTLDTLEGKDVMLQFPSTSSHTATVLVFGDSCGAAGAVRCRLCSIQIKKEGIEET